MHSILQQTDLLRPSPGDSIATIPSAGHRAVWQVEPPNRGGLSYMERITFQYYPARVDTNTPTGDVTLRQMLISIKHPHPKTLSTFKAIEQAEIDGDKQRKAELKQGNLFYFTPCVYVNGYRRYLNIGHFTGLMVADFDHIDNADELKEALFNEYRSIIAAWLSPSRRGVKCIFRIPIVETVEQFKEYYFGLASELDYIAGFDPSGQNAVLPLFQSYDTDLLYRDDYEVWETKGMKRDEFTAKEPVNAPPVVQDDRTYQIMAKLIGSGFSNIVDYGHPPLRSLCLSIGGYVASGYISELDALNIIDWEIQVHPYLKKGIEGYKKTARWALTRGQSKPLRLRHE